MSEKIQRRELTWHNRKYGKEALLLTRIEYSISKGHASHIVMPSKIQVRKWIRILKDKNIPFRVSAKINLGRERIPYRTRRTWILTAGLENENKNSQRVNTNDLKEDI